MLRRLFGDHVERAPLRGINDYGDFVNVPWLHESKSTAAPKFLEWSRVASRKAGTDWVVLYKPDLRMKESQELVLMPVAKYEELASFAKIGMAMKATVLESVMETIYGDESFRVDL